MSVVGPAFIYSPSNKLFCLGHLETISLSCRRTIAFSGSDTRGISPVVMKFTYEFKSCFCSVSIPQCTGCFWKESWGSTPWKGERPPVHDEILGHGPGLIQSHLHLSSRGDQKAQPAAACSSFRILDWLIYKWTAPLPCSLRILIKIKWKHFMGKVHVFQNTVSKLKVYLI